MSNPPAHKARKRFGQNFLQDTNIIHQIMMAISAQPSDHLVEIGPGQGAITEPLLASGCELDVVELDRDLVSRLIQQFSHSERFTLHSADALTFNFPSLSKGEKLRVVGNLPYNISTPLLFHLLENASIIEDMHFMLQKEVVNRMQAIPGNKQYGRLSIMIQLHCQVEALFDVSPDSFFPPPKVMSSIVRLIPHSTKKYAFQNIKLFEKLVAEAFSQRRKTIRNSLKNSCTEGQLNASNIKPTLRAEDLSIDDFVRLTNYLDLQQ
jgi:16S rRNA (adenine1518-N6/adenine1519-N6)-dimethyltransferase